VCREPKNTQKWEYKAFYIEPKSILLYEPDIIVTREMGPHAVDFFRRSGIKVFITEQETVHDALTAFKETSCKNYFNGISSLNQLKSRKLTQVYCPQGNQVDWKRLRPLSRQVFQYNPPY